MLIFEKSLTAGTECSGNARASYGLSQMGWEFQMGWGLQMGWDLLRYNGGLLSSQVGMIFSDNFSVALFSEISKMTSITYNDNSDGHVLAFQVLCSLLSGSILCLFHFISKKAMPLPAMHVRPRTRSLS